MNSMTQYLSSYLYSPIKGVDILVPEKAYRSKASRLSFPFGGLLVTLRRPALRKSFSSIIDHIFNLESLNCLEIASYITGRCCNHSHLMRCNSSFWYQWPLSALTRYYICHNFTVSSEADGFLRNWSILDAILPRVAALALLAITCSNGKQRLWVLWVELLPPLLWLWLIMQCELGWLALCGRCFLPFYHLPRWLPFQASKNQLYHEDIPPQH